MTKGFGKTNTLVCIIISIAITFVFYILAEVMSAKSAKYGSIDSIAGATFVFILSMIITVSIIPQIVEKAFGKK
ncbi:MAG: hypothetical protein WC974_00370 [Thermoplasmata archaeon]